jgi:large subunit ribosomal protein L6
MSRIGRLPIPLPDKVEVVVDGGIVRVKGPGGTLEQAIAANTSIEIGDKEVRIQRTSDSKPAKSAHGLMRSLVANMVTGVTTGFSRTLEIVGVGFRAEAKGGTLTLSVGYSHPVVMDVPEDLEVAAETPTRLIVKGSSKQRVGQFASEIRRVRPPEPYKGKGIRYADERVRRKVGKAGVGGATA